VFNIAEGRGTRSREAHVPAVCEMLGVPCSHSDPLTLAATLDKAVAKKIVAADGVPTAGFVVASGAEDPALAGVSFPVVAKPLAEGSSMGIRRASRVGDAASLRRLVGGLVKDYAQPVLVEEFLPGAEFTVGVLGTGRSAKVVEVMEIVPKQVPSDEFLYSLEVKRNWEDEVAYHVPPHQPPALVERVREVALAAYRSLECRDVARIDLRVGADGEPKFLEANPLPGLNPATGDLPILCRLAGLEYRDLVGGIVRSACERHGLRP
jgi:D-alanine-D-alanine ligase